MFISSVYKKICTKLFLSLVSNSTFNGTNGKGFERLKSHNKYGSYAKSYTFVTVANKIKRLLWYFVFLFFTLYVGDRKRISLHRSIISITR